MLSRIFGLAQLEAAATDLVAGFSRDCPSPRENPGKYVGEKIVGRALSKLFEQVAALIEQRKYGVFKRARLAKMIQDQLLAKGYPSDMVARVVSAITINALIRPRDKT